MTNLIEIIRIYNQAIGMEFAIEKCVLLIKNNGKIQTTKRIEQPKKKKKKKKSERVEKRKIIN